jgi:hypothetical protein
MYLPLMTSTALIKHVVNINICMIYIEKLHTDDTLTHKDWYTVKQPTLVDLFYDCEVFGDTLVGKMQMLAEMDLGGKFGKQGLHVADLLKTKPMHNVIWEIDAVSFSSLSKVQQITLLQNHNMMLCDYNEGGYHIHKSVNQNLFKYAKRLYISTAGLDSYDHIEGVTATLKLPVFALITYRESLRTDNIPPAPSAETIREKTALALAHKARLPRLQMLAELHKTGMLKDTDWSLTVNFDEDGEFGDFLRSPNVSETRFHDDLSHPDVIEFINAKKHLLPKLMDHIERFEDCIPLDKKYAGKYSWYLGMETYRFIKFPTEKTFKGMLGGMPVLTMAPANFNYELEGLGFKMPFRDQYDYMEMGKDRAEAIVEIMQEKSVSMDVLDHNYNLMTSKVFLTNMLIKQLSFWFGDF